MQLFGVSTVLPCLCFSSLLPWFLWLTCSQQVVQLAVPPGAGGTEHLSSRPRHDYCRSGTKHKDKMQGGNKKMGNGKRHEKKMIHTVVGNKICPHRHLAVAQYSYSRLLPVDNFVYISVFSVCFRLVWRRRKRTVKMFSFLNPHLPGIQALLYKYCCLHPWWCLLLTWQSDSLR